MKTKTGILIFLFTVGTLCNVFCQQIFISSQANFNKYIYNPAVAGTDSIPLINLSYRQLWSGFADAPKEELISFHLPLAINTGAGAKVFKTSAGPISKTALELTYSYRVNLDFDNTKLSFGLSALLYQYSIDKNKIKLEDTNDEVLLKSSQDLIVPDANFGVYLYNEKYYAGIAVHQLFNRKVQMLNNLNLEQRQVRHYFLNAGYIYNYDPNIDLEPSINFKSIEAGVYQADFNLLCTYRDNFSIGMGYRTNDAIIILMNTNINHVSFGYSYDLSLNSIGKFSRGSHEIMATYRIR
jgi:type IX secretion system PorP/SprF family membrane protein